MAVFMCRRARAKTASSVRALPRAEAASARPGSTVEVMWVITSATAMSLKGSRMWGRSDVPASMVMRSSWCS